MMLLPPTNRVGRWVTEKSSVKHLERLEDISLDSLDENGHFSVENPFQKFILYNLIPIISPKSLPSLFTEIYKKPGYLKLYLIKFISFVIISKNVKCLVPIWFCPILKYYENRVDIV